MKARPTRYHCLRTFSKPQKRHRRNPNTRSPICLRRAISSCTTYPFAASTAALSPPEPSASAPSYRNVPPDNSERPHTSPLLRIPPIRLGSPPFIIPKSHLPKTTPAFHPFLIPNRHHHPVSPLLRLPELLPAKITPSVSFTLSICLPKAPHPLPQSTPNPHPPPPAHYTQTLPRPFIFIIRTSLK